MEKDLENLLTDPFDGKDLDGFQGKCKDIAKELFCHYFIKCNDKEYYFAEIEFYYWEENWNKVDCNADVTYPRDGYDDKDLFYHLSGIDICFKSSYADAKFGGILIRAIRDKEDQVTAGPLNCMLKILNGCNNDKMPQLLYSGKTYNSEENITPTYRALGKNQMEKEKTNIKLCFYDSSIPKEKWGCYKTIFNKKDGSVIKDKLCKYKTDRFNLSK